MSPADTPEIERKVAAQLGSRLLKILAPMRVRSLSLHNATGQPLWINGGELTEPQRLQVQEAQDAFALDSRLQHLERDLDGTRTLFFCTRTPDGAPAGLVFAVVSVRRRPDVDPGALRERVFTTLRRFSTADLMPPGVLDSRTGPTEPSAEQIAAIEAAKVKAEVGEAVSLRSRPYARLRPGGTTRRYEIVDAGTDSLEQDLKRAARLIALLKRRDSRHAPIPASFTLPLCATSVLSAEFLHRLQPMLQDAHLGEDMLGFSIPAAAWHGHATATELFIAQCKPLRCYVALDDFDLTRGGFDLLRAGALRCLKLDPALTTSAPDDRFAHANVAAIVKAARVLGLYCVAKGVKSAPLARWLASNGIEFADRASRVRKGDSTTRRARVLQQANGA